MHTIRQFIFTGGTDLSQINAQARTSDVIVCKFSGTNCSNQGYTNAAKWYTDLY